MCFTLALHLTNRSQTLSLSVSKIWQEGFFIGSDYIYPKESNRIAKAELVKAGVRLLAMNMPR
jgi:hypothetical protein